MYTCSCHAQNEALASLLCKLQPRAPGSSLAACWLHSPGAAARAGRRGPVKLTSFDFMQCTICNVTDTHCNQSYIFLEHFVAITFSNLLQDPNRLHLSLGFVTDTPSWISMSMIYKIIIIIFYNNCRNFRVTALKSRAGL